MHASAVDALIAKRVIIIAALKAMIILIIVIINATVSIRHCLSD
jgi:hypothetical protein